jgi:hypothetical protein
MVAARLHASIAQGCFRLATMNRIFWECLGFLAGLCEIFTPMRNRTARRPAKPAHFFATTTVFALTLLIASVHFVFPASAQPSAVRPPISQVQMEKLMRVIDKRGENVRLNDRISAALGLGEGLIIRQATATDPVVHQSYFFAAVPSTGQYLVGTRQLLGGDIFLVDFELRLVAGVSSGTEVHKIPLPEAGKKVQDILAKFEAFLEMN